MSLTAFNVLAETVLGTILTEFGGFDGLPPLSRMQSILSDRCRGEARREVRGIALALREGIASEFAASSSASETISIRRRSLLRLTGELGLESAYASWICDTWVRVLGKASLVPAHSALSDSVFTAIAPPEIVSAEAASPITTFISTPPPLPSSALRDSVPLPASVRQPFTTPSNPKRASRFSGQVRPRRIPNLSGGDAGATRHGVRRRAVVAALLLAVALYALKGAKGSGVLTTIPDPTVPEESAQALDGASATVGSVAEIRARYAQIEREVQGYQHDRLILEGFSAEGGTLDAYYVGGQVRKLHALNLRETGRDFQDLYFWDGRLFFAYSISERYDSVFSGTVAERTEDRYYFAADTLVRWVDSHGRIISPSTSAVREAAVAVQRLAAELLEARKRGGIRSDS